MSNSSVNHPVKGYYFGVTLADIHYNYEGDARFLAKPVKVDEKKKRLKKDKHELSK